MTRLVAMTLMMVCSTVMMVASALDVVHFTDGRVVKGRIVAQVPGESITIEDRDGMTITYPAAQVKSISHSEDRDYSKDDKQCRGFRVMADLGAGYAFGDSRGTWQYQASATAGYQINRLFFVGAGVAPSILTHSHRSHFVKSRDDKTVFLLPIYADFQADKRTERISPFIDVRIGGNFVGDCRGLYVSGSFGCRLNHFTLAANYTTQGSAYYGFYELHYKTHDYIGSVNLKIGYEF